ncbi:MAG: hypothetical protein OHK0017_13050 [Patescibacteria group bacterium]
MFDDNNSPFVSQYISELTLIWAGFNDSSEASLYEILAPLKQHLEKEQTLLAYSLCAFLGGNPLLSVWVEWINQYSNLLNNQAQLNNLNQEAVNSIYGPGILSQEEQTRIAAEYTSLQLQWMHSQMWEIHSLLIQKYPNVKKFIEPDFWTLHLSAKSFLLNMYAGNDLKLADVLENLSLDRGFLMITIPCILGMVFSFSDPDSLVNQEAIKWHDLRKIMDQISTLYGITSQTPNQVENYMHYTRLDQLHKIQWWNLSQVDKALQIKENQEIENTLTQLKIQLVSNIKEDIDRIILPEKYQNFLRELTDWIDQLNS